MSQNYSVKTYTPRDGLPNPFIYDAVQDSIGNMWFAHRTGICKYDGVEWTNYTEKDGLPETHYIKLTRDNNGNIWALPSFLGESIVYFDGDKWNEIPSIIKYIKSNKTATSFAVYQKDQKPVVAVGSNIGLFIFNGNIWYLLSEKDGLADNTIFHVSVNDSKFYLSTLRGISVLDNFLFNNDLNLKFDFPDRTILSSRFDDRKDKLWIYGSNWIGFIKDDHFKIVADNLDSPIIKSGLEFYFALDKVNRIYFGNRRQIFFLNRKTGNYDLLGRKTSYLTDGATSVFVDRENNLWVTSLRGVTKVRSIPFINYYELTGLLEDEVTAVSQFDDGTFLFAHNRGFTLSKDDQFTIIPFIVSIDGRSTLTTRVLDVFNDGSKIYFTSQQQGIGTISSKGKINWLYSDDELVFNGIYIDSKGRKWVGTDKGIFLLVGKSLNRPQLKIPEELFVRKFYELENGIVAAATFQGLILMSDSDAKLSTAQERNGNNVFAVYQHSDRKVFVGTMDGLYIENKGRLEKYFDGSYSINRPVYFIKGNKENIWFGTDDGVIRYFNGKYEHYTVQDGLAGIETNRSAAFYDSDERFWIGCDNGLSCFYEDYAEYTPPKPNIEILYLEDAEGTRYKLDEPLDLGYNQYNISIHYRALTFIDENAIRYKVALKDKSGKWVDEFITTESQARFTNLEEGDYTFVVSARNASGIWSSEVTTAKIVINEPFYNQFWFHSIAVVLLGFILYGVQNYYSQKRYSKKLENDVKKRTEELRDSEQRYRTVVETSPESILILDRNVKIKFCNRQSLIQFGVDKFSGLIGKSALDIVSEADRKRAGEELQKRFEDKKGRGIEYQLIKNDGSEFPAEINSTVITDDKTGTMNIVVIIKDITEYKKAQETLKNINIELEERVKDKTKELSALIDQSPLGILVYDNSGNLLEINSAIQTIFDISELGELSSTYNFFRDNLVLENPEFPKINKVFESGGSFTTKPVFINQADNILYDNVFKKWFVFRFYSIQSESGDVNRVVNLVEDVTQLMKIEEINRKFHEQRIRSEAILETIENERKRMSRDLHDDLGQILTSAKIKLEISGAGKKESENYKSEALDLVLRAHHELRNIVYDLQPVEIDKFGMVTAIDLMCSKIRKTKKINIEFFNVNYNKKFDDKYELAIYRIIQEALNNIVKHSGCTEAFVKLEESEDELIVEIEDNGKGFDADFDAIKNGRGKGFGLRNIYQRAEFIGGKFELVSEIGSGTKIKIIVPVVG
ncbi:MAG: PAS domain S-box protein [Melioribacteraceae bacterium]|nr:PAS domain S-box protein [Melioribacteraceae bacterium]MCF8353366.1 PAS domain S-box protein [Melioribacteraceae bacterium]MCF8393055.1 PAS domain S-box protein [Melioribacteraceae bacterium]MCF8419092.1 PAS domain S-box protein [Melioribacteraceae bacterium]